MSSVDPEKELDEFVAAVQPSEQARDRPNPLTPEYVAEWARDLVQASNIGKDILDAIYGELTPGVRIAASKLGFDQIVYAMNAYAEEMSDIVAEIEDGDPDYDTLFQEYLEGRAALTKVADTLRALWENLGSPAPDKIKRLPGGPKLFTVMRGTLVVQDRVEDLGQMIDSLWGSSTAPPVGDSTEPWYDANPTEPVPVPTDANPLVFALDEAKKDNPNPKTGDVIHVYTEPYDGVGLEFKSSGWTPLIQYEPWWGDALLVLHGTGVGTSIIQPVGGDGWGASWAARYVDGWSGRMHVVGFMIICSGRNGIAGGSHGEQRRRPLLDMKFIDCWIVDGPEVCTRPVTFYQWQLQMVRCRWDCVKSLEHSVYGHNAVGDCGMRECIVDGGGGQIWQEVARPHEGPTYDGETTLEDCFFENYHQFGGRAGSAITQAGSGRTFHVKRSTLLDVERTDAFPGSGPRSFGAHVSWSGGVTDYRPLTGGFANEACFYEDVDIVHKDPGRATLAFGMIRNVSMLRCGVWSPKGIHLIPNTGELIDSVSIRECNTPEIRQRVLDRVPGLDPALLIDGPIYFGSDRKGRVSDGIEVKDGALVTV